MQQYFCCPIDVSSPKHTPRIGFDAPSHHQEHHDSEENSTSPQKHLFLLLIVRVPLGILVLVVHVVVDVHHTRNAKVSSI